MTEGDAIKAGYHSAKKEREEFINCAKGLGDRASPSVRAQTFQRLFLAQNHFALAHELIVQP